MLLATCTLNSGTKRVSGKRLTLEHPWFRQIRRMDPVHFGCRDITGGYASLEFGSIEFLPTMFDGAGDWPPQKNIGMVAQHTVTTEAAAVTVFAGTLHRAGGMLNTGIKYDLYPVDDFDTTVANGQVFNDTLVNVFAWACDAARLNLTLDITAARSPSPAIVHTTDKDWLLIDLLSAFAAYHSHWFYIQDGTLYLGDMLAANGAEALTKVDYFAPEPSDEPPYSQITDGDANTVYTAYPYGEPYTVTPYQTAGADITAALNNIKTIIERPQIAIGMPIPDTLPVIGKKYTATTTRTAHKPTAIEVYCRRVEYDFLWGNRGRLTIIGDGSLAAA